MEPTALIALTELSSQLDQPDPGALHGRREHYRAVTAGAWDLEHRGGLCPPPSRRWAGVDLSRPVTRGFCALGLAAALTVGLVSGLGCAQASRMRLADPVPGNPRSLVWWCMTSAGAVRPPMVGIEISGDDSRTDQWILTERGVRCYRYNGRDLIAVGPPLPTTPTPADFEQTRRWLRHYLPQASPRRALPAREVAEAVSMARLVELLRTNWLDVLVAPPAQITPRRLVHELEAFPHGLAELLAASDAM